MEELWSDIIPSVIKIPYKIYRNRYSIQYWYKKLEVLLDSGDTNIVVVGRPTVGKTVLTKHLNEKISIQTDTPEASDDIEVDVLKLKKWSKIIRTIPGQVMLDREKGLEEAFDKHDNLDGVIYVADWGYTKIRSRLIEQKMISENNITTIDNLRKYNLNLELDDFKHMLNKIRQAKSNNRGPKWLMIAVNKVDLYYDEIDNVQKYYHPDFKSEFTLILNDFLSFVGTQNIKCVSLPISCWEENLIWNNETVKTQLGGVDNKRALFLNFHKELVKLCNK